MFDINKILINQNDSIKHVIKVIDEGSVQCALVIDDSQKLTGIVTDGDIRRGLLSGISIENSVETIMKKDFLKLPSDYTDKNAKLFMEKNKIKQVPCIDSDGKIVKLCTYDNLFNKSLKENLVVIMAGGRGTRLLPFTKNCPKPMLHIKWETNFRTYY